jgi:GT2 family glycosyltransferase
MPLSVSLIFLNWNGKQYLDQCLSSALKQAYAGESTIIMVDNGSTDGSASYVRSRFPQVRVIENGRNLGYAGGMNVGLRAATSDVSVILNNDVILPKDWLAELVKPMAEDPSIGVAGCKIFYPDGETLQHAGGIVQFPRMSTDHYGYREVDDGAFEALRDVDYVTSAAMALRSSMLAQIGYLDEGFFPIYYDDVDICLRACDAGFRVVYVPSSTMIHLESATVGYASLGYLLNMHAGRLRFALKRLSAEAFADAFVPAEVAWLAEEATADEKTVISHAYLAAMLNYPKVVAEWETQGNPAHAQEIVSGGLAQLRDAVWRV